MPHARRGTRTPTPERYWILNPARLPIPPPSLLNFLKNSLPEQKDYRPIIFKGGEEVSP